MDDRNYDPKIATVRAATGRKTHAIKADHHKISAIKCVRPMSSKSTQIDTLTPGAFPIWCPSVTF